MYEFLRWPVEGLFLVRFLFLCANSDCSIHAVIWKINKHSTKAQLTNQALLIHVYMNRLLFSYCTKMNGRKWLPLKAQTPVIFFKWREKNEKNVDGSYDFCM